MKSARSKQAQRVFIVTLSVGMLMAACIPAPTVPPIIRETVEIPVTVQPQVVQGPASPPADPSRLVVYSGRSENLVAPIIAQFADATGIQVDVRYGSTSEMAVTLLEEGTNSPADIFFAQDPGGLGAVAEAGLLAPLPEDVVAKIPERFRSKAGLWVGISGRARTVVYNTERLSPQDLPDDIWDFTDPKWSGRIGWAPTNGSLQAMVTAMRVVWGEAKTRQWLEGIIANRPKVYEGNAPIVQAVGDGEIDIGFVNHYYLYRFLKEEGEKFKARNYFLPSGGPGSLIMVAGAGRLAGGENEANAIKFLEFLLSPVAQQYFASQTYEYPVVDGVSTQYGLTPLAELDEMALEIDLTDLTDLQGTTRLLQEVNALP
jgi:iron(III) transport system substrate-binding protein